MIDRAALLDWPFEEKVHHYTARDTMLYALSIGYGDDPMDPAQLRYVLEDRLQAAPTMALVLAHPGPWTADPRTGINRSRLVHGEQSLQMHRRLPPAGTVRSRNRIVDVVDKGVDKGAIIYNERELMDDATGERIATIAGATVCRADGGFGGPPGAPRPVPTPPERAPDAQRQYRLPTQSALLYRLNGDYNPLHSHPETAARAGYSQPIAHGLLSFGVCARLLTQDGGTLRAIQARFVKPMFPGETLVVQSWRGASGELHFVARCLERDVVVLGGGLARIDPEETAA